MSLKSISIAGLVLTGILFFGSAANAQSFVYSGAPGLQTVIGWNFAHASNCQVQVAGPTVWYLVVAQEGGYAHTDNASVAAILAPACQTGNWFAIHVTSLSPFAWDSLVLYPLK